MTVEDLSEKELRAALAAADRGIRLSYGMIALAAAITALAIFVTLRVVDWSNTTHVLIICASGFLYSQMHFFASVITARQNAANARMLRALEKLESRGVNP